MTRGFLAASIALGIATAPVTARACANFGVDAIPIFRVQKSWGPAERSMDAGHYAQAVVALQGATEHLASIHDPKLRSCVTEGHDQRLVSAKAGSAYLAVHPMDVVGAKRRADAAWRDFPARHDCP